VGYILRNSGRVYVHTGDFKLDETPVDGVPTGLPRLARLAAEEGVEALFSDSTNVEREGHSLPESFVGEALEEIFRNAPGRVITAMFSSNVHRMQAVLEAAARTGRRVALCGRSMVRNLQTSLELGYVRFPHPEILVPVERVEEMAPRTVALLTTGSQGEPRSALTRIALGEYKHVKVREGDTAVLSSKFIPGNERAICSLIDHLALAGAEVLYDTISEVHVSGHGSRDELLRMIETVKPAHFVPIHGEPRLLIRHRRLAAEAGVASAFILRNGDSVVFDGKGGARKEEGEAPGRLFVDGTGVGDVEGFVLKDRRQLSQVGVVMVVMAVSAGTGEILYGPDVVARGVVTEKDDEELLDGARQAALDEWEATGVEARKDYAEFKDGLRRALRRYFNRRIERKPVILPVLLEL
jgi:ribonuclease J